MERRILSITTLLMLLCATLLLSDSQHAQVGTLTTPAACNPIPPNRIAAEKSTIGVCVRRIRSQI